MGSDRAGIVREPIRGASLVPGVFSALDRFFPGCDDRLHHLQAVPCIGRAAVLFLVLKAVPGSVAVETVLFDEIGADCHQERGLVVPDVVAAGRGLASGRIIG